MKFEESILTKTIYYVDASILATIDADFNFIEGAGWYELYQYNYDQSFWRLDRFDKLKERFLSNFLSGMTGLTTIRSRWKSSYYEKREVLQHRRVYGRNVENQVLWDLPFAKGTHILKWESESSYCN